MLITMIMILFAGLSVNHSYSQVVVDIEDIEGITVEQSTYSLPQLQHVQKVAPMSFLQRHMPHNIWTFLQTLFRPRIVRKQQARRNQFVAPSLSGTNR